MSMKRSSSTASEMNDFKEEGGKKEYQVRLLVYFAINIRTMFLNAIYSTCNGNQVSKSRLVSLIDWFTVFRRYVPIIWYLVLVVLTAQIAMVLFRHRLDFHVSCNLVTFSFFGQSLMQIFLLLVSLRRHYSRTMLQ